MPIDPAQATVDTAAIAAAQSIISAIIGAIIARHKTDNPSAPPITEAQALAALHQAAAATLAKDKQLEASLGSTTDIGSDVPGGGAKE
jgi:hypothetical protein